MEVKAEMERCIPGSVVFNLKAWRLWGNGWDGEGETCGVFWMCIDRYVEIGSLMQEPVVEQENPDRTQRGEDHVKAGICQACNNYLLLS